MSKSLFSCRFTEEVFIENAYNITSEVLIIPRFLEITLKGFQVRTKTTEVCFNSNFYRAAYIEVYSPLYIILFHERSVASGHVFNDCRELVLFYTKM